MTELGVAGVLSTASFSVTGLLEFLTIGRFITKLGVAGALSTASFSVTRLLEFLVVRLMTGELSTASFSAIRLLELLVVRLAGKAFSICLLRDDMFNFLKKRNYFGELKHQSELNKVK
jgi:hypothetical protein